jgi:hypothetical protein
MRTHGTLIKWNDERGFMVSCAEATFFIRNCPGTTMDGDNDGVPCESQWCN